MTLDDVAHLVAKLPGTTEGERHGNRTWSVGGKGFAWERPFSKADLRRFGDEPVPDGPILAVRVENLNEKEALLAEHPDFLFTIPHFNGYAAVLIRLPAVTRAVLEDVLLDGWLAFAPRHLVQERLGDR